ncbi:MAG TPA: PASTA domain-containing protein [Candidatus Hydrogenedentes bacterium]|nr:PASTA domain-containing protein [Candidatus Hydrogenedentota bacterium]
MDVEAIFGPEPDGPPTTVPDVVGMDQETAKSAIESVGFYMGSVTKTYSGTVPEGNVLSQAPAAGSVIPGGSMISIAVAIAEDFSAPDVEVDLLSEDVDWADFPDVDAEKEAIAETLDSFADALKAGDADAAADMEPLWTYGTSAACRTAQSLTLTTTRTASPTSILSSITVIRFLTPVGGAPPRMWKPIPACIRAAWRGPAPEPQQASSQKQEAILSV